MDNADSKPLDEITELIRSLTYGEMVEVASELQKAPVETKHIGRLATLVRSLTKLSDPSSPWFSRVLWRRRRS